MEKLVCYRFQCAKYLTCLRSAGTACWIERDPELKELPDGACTKENDYPYFQPGKGENPVHAWLRGRT